MTILNGSQIKYIQTTIISEILDSIIRQSAKCQNFQAYSEDIGKLMLRVEKNTKWIEGQGN